MGDDKPDTVKMEVIKEPHSYMGKDYKIGDTYEADPQYVDSIIAQGMAVRVDRVAHAKEQAKAAEKAAKERSTATPVMGIATTTPVAPVAPLKGAKIAKPAKAAKSATVKAPRKAK